MCTNSNSKSPEDVGQNGDIPPLISTDRVKYATDQVVHIFGKAFDNNGNPYNGTVRIDIKRTHAISEIGCFSALKPSDQVVSNSAVIPVKNGSYYYDFMNDESGKYFIGVSKNASNVNSSTTIEILGILSSHFTIWLLLAGDFFLGLLFLLLVTSYKYKVPPYHISQVNLELPGILRFFCISGIVFSIISAFIFTDVEIGTNSPIGLVIRHDLNPHSGIDLDRNGNPVDEWVINIGGSWRNNFSSGVYVPVYVIFFGILGGYLRYLYKTASKEESREVNKSTTDFDLADEQDSNVFMKVTLAEFAQIVLSPMLAIITWFMLAQGQNTNNIFLLAVVSFSVGLLTRDIIRGIIKFVVNIIPIEKKSTK